MLRNLHARRFSGRRRLIALASVAALSLGTLGLAGCGNDEEELPPMEEPAQDPGAEEPMGEPMEEEPMTDPQGEDEQNDF